MPTTTAGPVRIVDVSGFMFSGKAAVTDLLREFSGVFVPYYRTEFDLLRVGGGLSDLHNAVIDWSPVRVHAALDRFERVVRKMASRPRFPMNLFLTGSGYESRYPGLLAWLNLFLNEATVLSWRTPWPYDDLHDGPLTTFARKLLNKFGIHWERTYRLTSPEAFEPAARRFVFKILTRDVDVNGIDVIVTHNALEPFNPAAHLTLLGENAKSIAVDRDPRDVFATAVTMQEGFNDKRDFYKRIAGAHDTNVFIKRYNLYHAMVRRCDDVLRVRFEDLVDCYEMTVGRLCEFVGIDRVRHQRKQTSFSPGESAKTVGLWKQPALRAYRKDFERIAAECQVSER